MLQAACELGGLRGATALVSGAASGIGRAAVERLAARGMRIAALDVEEAGLADVAARVPGVQPPGCDVSDLAEVRGVRWKRIHEIEER
jgi:NAD(P)-dependent dehydrogenase (short-subunit alcohol dehydrogenase family)